MQGSSRSVLGRVPLVLVAALGCRVVPPPSGTPLGAGESLAVGVVREYDGWGLRQADLIASSEQIAADIARLTGTGKAGVPWVLLLDEPSNATAHPAGSFAPIRFQLVSGIARACEARGFRVVRPADAGAAAADYTVLSEIHGLGPEDGSFVVNYVVVAGSHRAQRGDGLLGRNRTTAQ